MVKLLIVESNAKCKKIEGFLGNDYKCIASFGHIREFMNGLKSIDVDNNYKPMYKFIASKNKFIYNLKMAIKKCDEVILATDDDREGEAIAWHLCQSFNLSVNQTKRIKFNEITKTAILSALENHTTININKVYSQQARSILDLLVGYKITPYLWKHISRNSKDKLSAGRCQTPALKLIYEREEEIKNNPGKKIYETSGTFDIGGSNMLFTLNYNYTEQVKMEKFLEQNVNFNHIIKKLTITNKISQPPKPFTTSLLQQKSSNELHYSPKQTMTIAQKLYENGWITYMRTDCDKYSKEFVDKGKKHIKQTYDKNYINKNINRLIITLKKSDNKNTQEAHEAIRPTKIDRIPDECQISSSIDNRALRLYRLIWNNTMESIMSEAKYNQIACLLAAPEKHIYRKTEDMITFPGWKIIRGYEKTNENYDILSLLNKQTKYNYNEINSEIKLKDQKMHYSEAKLVQLLEKKGIGRPSTFSSLIDKIQTRKYVLKQNINGKKVKCINFKLKGCELEEKEEEKIFGNEKNKLVITSLGVIVLEFLIKYYETIFEYNYTEKMECLLDEIEQGKGIWYNLCKQCDEQIENLSKKIPIKGKKVYKIDNNHVYMIGRYGPVVKYEDKEGNIKFKNVKKNLDMSKLENNEYNLEDILEEYKKNTNILGLYEDKEIILKKGKYGLYITYNDKNYTLKHLKKEEHEITLEDAIKSINYKKSNPNIIKELSNTISIRKGKYGPYVMVKKEGIKKPIFLKIKKGEDLNTITLDWVHNKL
jgi:DNA topoisomerase I